MPVDIRLPFLMASVIPTACHDAWSHQFELDQQRLSRPHSCRASLASIVYGEPSSAGNAGGAATLAAGSGSNSRDQEGDGTSVGRQGVGTTAGSRIQWSWDQKMSTRVAVYYDDAGGGRRGEERHSNKNQGEGEQGRKHEEAGKEKQETQKDTLRGTDQDLEYLGCFRDHPGSSREFAGGDSRREVDDSQEGDRARVKFQGLQYRQGKEGGDSVFIYARSLTPSVSEILTSGIIHATTDSRAGIVLGL